MKNMELLAPAGDMQSLKMAVYYGANAVYLGIKDFNARNNIQGFGLDTLGQAVDFAHLFGVKVYLALNILFNDDELQSALDVVAEANNIGVDAFIVQDLGLVHLIKKFYPSVELHASTQMAVHNLEGVKVLEKLGFSRVVLARETSKDEIKRISQNSNIEIEFFVQGALCVGFSGNCYMCSHLVNKSGNRGLCQQFCRLPYTFEDEDIKKSGYLLSAKDICMLDNLADLQECGVCSLKIEGRARRPFYVAQACKVYRQMLDYGKVDKGELDNLNLAFNRGFTPAYFNGNGNIISSIQGNNGLEIGVVKKVNNGSKFNEVFIQSNYDLKGKCGLKFVFNAKEIASIGAVDIQKQNNLYRVTTTSKINIGSKVYIIQDENLEQQILNYLRKIKVDICVNAIANQPIKAVASIGNITASVEGEICQQAKTISTSCEQVYKQFLRSEIFDVNTFDCNLNDCYILNSTINKLRNALYENLKQKMIEKHKKIRINKINIKNYYNNLAKNKNINNFAVEICEDVNKLKICNNLIYDYNDLNAKDIKAFDEYCSKHNINGYVDVPNFATGKDIMAIKNVLQNTKLGIVANNLYALNFDCKMIGGQFLNVYNSFTVQTLKDLHEFDALFVEELSDNEMQNINSDIPLVKRERVYMTLLHCPFKSNIGCDCTNCAYSQNATLKLNSGKKFKIKRKRTSSCVFLLKD